MKSLLTIKNYLVAANIALVVALIFLANLKILPLQNVGDFGFFVGLVFLLSLYRPSWSFLFFVGTIMLENINLAPVEFGLVLRPYQLIGLVTLIAVSVRYFSGRLGFKLPKFFKADIFIVIFLIVGFASSIFALDRGIAFKQSFILLSFGALYFLTRIFIQNLSDLKRVIPFFLSSSAVVTLYGIWQNWQFTHGGVHFEVMSGRPNATFSEPDWLGMFLVFVLAVIYAVVFYFTGQEDNKEILSDNLEDLRQKFGLRISDFFHYSGLISAIIHKLTMKNLLSDVTSIWSNERSNKKMILYFLYLLLVVYYILLTLTVSRSAWLGAIVVTLIFCGYVFRKKEYRMILGLVVAFLLSVGVIYVFNLTNFELGKRLQSTAGLQEITVSCKQLKQDLNIKRTIWDTEQLRQIGCQHINLEEIKNEKAMGNFVTKVYRDDPNVNIRAKIYEKSWEQIKKYPIVGIGWGNISQTLGTDENGNGLNASNIFLEVWLGSGIIGLVSFILILSWIFWKNILLPQEWKYYFELAKNSFVQKSNLKNKNYNSTLDYHNSTVTIEEKNIWNLFVMLSFFAIFVPNLFNSGIMLGFLWFWLAITQINSE